MQTFFKQELWIVHAPSDCIYAQCESPTPCHLFTSFKLENLRLFEAAVNCFRCNVKLHAMMYDVVDETHAQTV